ncbi:ABC transporter substrate-binding protein, partial [Knoellia sp. Soil729]|uniref:ABC transporter substrate-binding protein n=1 Tax=Knoellia sp. Soil729 TaxID=1736394 RepID=UPI000AF269FD
TKYSATIDAFSTDDQFRRIPTSQVTHTQVDRKGAQEYFDSYVKKYGENPSYLPPSASAAGLSLQLAVEAADSLDSEKVRQALVDLKADTFFGMIDYTAKGDPSGLTGANVNRPMLTIQLDAQGKQVVVAPKEAAKADIEPLKPWNER